MAGYKEIERPKKPGDVLKAKRREIIEDKIAVAQAYAAQCKARIACGDHDGNMTEERLISLIDREDKRVIALQIELNRLEAEG